MASSIKKKIAYPPSQDQTATRERLKKILAAAKGRDLFKEIENPSEWQRCIRNEWLDRVHEDDQHL
jgi:ABC-type uncharacterized transport system fused permease/ATPase subunit